MKNKFLELLTLFLFCCVLTNAQESKNKDYPLKADVETIDGIIKAHYDVISGPAGQPRDWARDASLQDRNALWVFTGVDKNKKPYMVTNTVTEYHDSFGTPKVGFWEYEVYRETQKFGNITHVWSTYELTEEENGPVKGRGMNSIQLYYDGNRWWILSWMFDSERADNPIPKKHF
jgi:hypothetical protein